MRGALDSESGHKSRIAAILLAAALILLTVFRLMMSLTLHMAYKADQTFDDALLMRQSFIPISFISSEVPVEDGFLILAKNRGYGWWIKFFSATGLPADLWQFIMWLLAAVTVSYALWRVFRSLPITVFAYCYVIWNPIAFEHWLGIRLYRNSLFAPLVFVLLGSAILLFDVFTPLIDDRVKCRYVSNAHHARLTQVLSIDTNRLVARFCGYAVIAVVCGLTAAVLYLLKEDSEWLLPLLIFIVIYKLIAVSSSKHDAWVKVIVCLLTLSMPLTFAATVAAAKSANQRDFGVSVLNTRTEGELAGFVARIYKIDNPDQTPRTWAPVTSIEQAFQASPTLQQVPKLQWNLEHGGFVVPDIRENPVYGDFLTWQIRIALNDSGLWENEESVQQLFAKANRELDAAFESGQLQETDKHTPSEMAVPRTLQQIFGIVPDTLINFYQSFDPHQVYKSPSLRNTAGGDELNIQGLQQMNVDPNNPNPEHFRFLTYERASRLAAVIMRIYVVINYCLLVTMLIAIVATIHRRKLHGNLQRWRMLIFAALMMLYGLAYSFSIAWFAEFLMNQYVSYFYSAGVVAPFIAVGLLMCTGVALINKNLDSSWNSGARQVSSSTTHQ